jgi:hypothetical protein
MLKIEFNSKEELYKNLGNNELEVEITDREGKAAKYKFSLLLFKLEQEQNDQPIPQETIEESQNETHSGVTAFIESISSLGLMIVKFSTPMKNESVNITHLNETVLGVYIEPAEDRHLSSGFDIN